MAELQTLFVYTCRCRGCGALNVSSRLFDCNPLQAPRYKPAVTRNPAIAIVKQAVHQEPTPICHLCIDEQEITDEVKLRWRETIRRKAEGVEPPTVRMAQRVNSQRPHKSPPTLDDIA